MKVKFEAAFMRVLSRVALGEQPADLIINNTGVLNVYTGEIHSDYSILVKGERIAYVGPEGDFPVGSATEVIDAGGLLAIPGMIDGHIHMDAWMSVGEFVKMSLPRGTTTIITECTASSDAMGVRGVLEFIKQLRGQPQRFFVTAPVISFLCSNFGDNDKAIDLSGMEHLLKQPEVLGLGEIYWPLLLNSEAGSDLALLIEKALAMGKTVEGHGAGAKKRKLAALAAHGINSCHEPITAEEVRERLRLGLFTMIREGSVRQELEAVIGPLLQMNLDLRRASLVSDGIWPSVLLHRGHMDHIVQKAISLGLDPITAIRMVTLNAAEHFGLDDDLGAIAPGKCADLALIPDPEKVEPRLVICRGKPVAQEGKMLVNPAGSDFAAEAYQCVKVPILEADFFRVPADGREVNVRVIELITSILNREIILNLPVVNGAADASRSGDVAKVAVIDRYSGNGRGTTGYIKGYGLSHGALASSFSFDEGNLVVIGCSDTDMAAAVNRIGEMRGGLVYYRNGKVVAEIPMPIFGSVSELPGPEVAAGIESIERAVREAGCRVDNPLLTLFTITFTAIPSLRLLARGYWRARENRLVEVFE